MTRKHFEAIAEALRESGASEYTITAVAVRLARFNPAFNYTRFIRASMPLNAVTHKDGSVTRVGTGYDGKLVLA